MSLADEIINGSYNPKKRKSEKIYINNEENGNKDNIISSSSKKESEQEIKINHTSETLNYQKNIENNKKDEKEEKNQQTQQNKIAPINKNTNNSNIPNQNIAPLNSKISSQDSEKIKQQIEEYARKQNTGSSAKYKSLNQSIQDGEVQVAPEKKWYQKFFKTPDAIVLGGDAGDVIGNIPKTFSSTIMHGGAEATKGAYGIVEGITDLAKYGLATSTDMNTALFKKIAVPKLSEKYNISNEKAEQIADLASQQSQSKVLGKITNEKIKSSKDLRESAKEDDFDESFAGNLTNDFRRNSVLGETSEKVANAVGYTTGLALTAGIGGGTGAGAEVATNTGSKIAVKGGNLVVGKLKMPILAATTAASQSLNDTYTKNPDADDATAWTRALGAGFIEAGTEGLFGTLGVGGSALDDALVSKASQKFSSAAGKQLSQLGIKATGEAAEEVISYSANQLMDLGIDKTTGTKYKDDWDWNELGESIAIAYVSTGISQGGATSVNLAQESNQRIAEIEKAENRKLTGKEKSEIVKQTALDIAKMVESENDNAKQQDKLQNDLQTENQKQSGQEQDEVVNTLQTEIESENKENQLESTEPNYNENMQLDNNQEKMYNVGESESDYNGEIQREGMGEISRQYGSIIQQESLQQTETGAERKNTSSERKYDKTEYGKWEQSIKQKTNLTTEEQQIKNEIKNRYNKNLVFINESNGNYSAGSSLNNNDTIYINSQEAEEFGIKKVIFHEVMENNISKYREISNDIVKPFIKQILEDSNFEKQKEIFWKNQNGKMPSDYAIAKDIFCDRFAEIESGENLDYENVLSKQTNLNMDYVIDNFMKELESKSGFFNVEKIAPINRNKANGNNAESKISKDINTEVKDIKNEIKSLKKQINDIKAPIKEVVKELQKVTEQVKAPIVNKESTDIKEKAPLQNKHNSTENDNEKIAKVLTERENYNNHKQRLLAKIKAAIFDKGAVFEDLSKKTKNRNLEAKWDNMLLSEAKAQSAIGNGISDMTYQYSKDKKVNKQNIKNAKIVEKTKSLNSIREEVVNSGKIEQFSNYMYHLLNIDRMTLDKRFQEKNKPVFGNTIGAEYSRQKSQELENKNPEFIEWAKDIYDYNKALRDVLVKNDVISQETAKYFEEKYPHYIPIQRVGNNGKAINVPLDTNRTGVNNPIKKAKGGNQDILPLFDSIANRTLQTYKAATRNSFGIELKNTLNSQINAEEVAVESILDSVNEEQNLLQEGKDGKSPTFTVFENGKKVTYNITQDMYDALKPVSDSSILSTTFKPLNKAANLHRSVLTEYNPLFSLTNAIKDIQDVLINSQHAGKTYAKFGEAYKQILNKGYWYNEYLSNGGEQNSYFNTQDGFDEKKTKLSKLSDSKIVQAVKLPLTAISSINNVIEMAPRLAEYIASREAGRSIETSMLDAARVTTNFKAGGDVTKFLNRNGATFLNASVQGFNQNIRNIREANMNGLRGYMNLVTKFAIAAAPALLLNGLVWKDDKEYDELSDYVKQNYYIVGKLDDGTFIRIPKGRMSAVLQEGLNQANYYITGDDKADFKSFLDLAINNLAPNNPIENNVLAPIGQVMSNKTWYGSDLVPSRLQNEPAEEQFDESTDKFSIWLGQEIGISPYKINYLLNQYSGGIGDVLLPMGTTEAETKTTSDNKILNAVTAPFVDKFTTNSTMNNKYISDLYSTSDKLVSKANSVNATDNDILKNMYINSIKSEMNELYKDKREVQSNEGLSDKQKYDRVMQIQRKIDNIAKKGIENYKDVTQTNHYASIGEIEYYKYTEKDGTTVWKKLDDEEKVKINKLKMNTKQKESYFQIIDEINKSNQNYTNKKDNIQTSDFYSEDSPFKKVDVNSEDKKDISNERKSRIIQLIKNSNLSDTTKAYIYSKSYSSDEKMQKMLDAGVDMNNYLKYEFDTFEYEKKNDDDESITRYKTEYLKNSNMSNNDKRTIYELSVLNDFDDDKKYKAYKAAKDANIGIEDWLTFSSQEFKSDKNSNGKAIANSRKNKIVKYVNSMNLSIPQKAILIRSEYSSYKDYNNQIVSYVNSLNLTVSEKTKILENLDMKVSNGKVSWK